MDIDTTTAASMRAPSEDTAGLGVPEPLVPERQLHPDTASRPHDGLGTPQPRLLYIEDNLSDLTLVEWILDREANIELISAMQGGPGLELAREHRPDLIVLDLHLPDMSGEDMLRCLKADDATREIPVVVLSADASPKRIEQMLALGALDYLTKPLDIGHFVEVVAEVSSGDRVSTPAGD